VKRRFDELLENLSERARGCARRDVALRDHTTYRVGGPAALWFEVGAERDLIEIVNGCRERAIPIALLGNGSNVIAPDAGIEGVVLKLGRRFAALRDLGDDLLYAEAGALLEAVSAAALERRRRGLEWMVDIPGSVGGAAIMNAGNNEGEMKAALTRVRFLSADGEVRELAVDQLDLGYRHSRFKGSGEIVLGATFRLGAPDSEQAINARMHEQKVTRRRKFPMEHANAGSVFKRPAGDYAGRLIEVCGLKGLRVGDAQVSTKHAGFIVNLGAASSADIIGLAHEVRRRVEAETGVALELEQLPLVARVPGTG
jgi:UDP-N-acetylmuramate dehydrogenase